MVNRGLVAALLTSASLSIACSSGVEPPRALEVDSFVTYPTLGAPDAPAPGAPTLGGLARGPAGGPGELQLSGHLEGQLNGIQLSGATTENFGYLETWDGGGFLNMNAALGTAEGAGMIILSLSGGLDHPVFTDGTWSDARDADQLGGVTVASCAGPALGNYPYEQQAVDYDMSVETDSEHSDRVVVVVAAAFPSDLSGVGTEELTATLSFEVPETARPSE